MLDIAPDQRTVDHDGQPAVRLDPDTAVTVQKILIQLASEQENAAASEAAQVPYWKACPDSVRGSRAAARALRAVAESLSVAGPRRPSNA